GLSKFADAIDLEEAEYLVSLKQQLTDSSFSYFIGGYGYSNSLSSWVWAACSQPLVSSVWHEAEPNGGSARHCTSLYRGYRAGGIDDTSCSWSLRYICECQSVF
ncbi:hypothetical protein BOX15_Mlig013886g1, partial [Macrostomum lignano]